MQLASLLSELDVQDKSPPGQSSTNSGWDKVFEDSGASQDEEELEDALRIELQIYLKEKRSNITMDSLKCWKANPRIVRNIWICYLAKIVRKYHCQPPGSAALERLLSSARHFMGSTGLHLTPKNFESLLLKYNLRTLNWEKATPPADFTPPTVADYHQMSLMRASRTMRNLTSASLMMKMKLKQRFMMIGRSIDIILFVLFLRVYTCY